MLEEGGISKATPLAANLVEVERATRPGFLVGVTSVARVTREVVEPFFDGNLRPSFVCNIPRDAIWIGDAIKALQANSMAFGGVGDLHRAVRNDNPRDYVFKEYAYVERRLRQHRKVTNIDRLFDRAWRVERDGLSSLIISISNEYDLTADEVRSSYDRYGPFDVFFHTNNLGRVTDEAQEAAEELDVEIIESGSLFERLGR